jgi:hypothetical protein
LHYDTAIDLDEASRIYPPSDLVRDRIKSTCKSELPDTVSTPSHGELVVGKKRSIDESTAVQTLKPDEPDAIVIANSWMVARNLHGQIGMLNSGVLCKSGTPISVTSTWSSGSIHEPNPSSG